MYCNFRPYISFFVPQSLILVQYSFIIDGIFSSNLVGVSVSMVSWTIKITNMVNKETKIKADKLNGVSFKSLGVTANTSPSS